MNSKKLLKNLEYSTSRDAKNFQYWSCGSRGIVQRSWPLFSFFGKTKIPHTHTFNNKEQNCMECKLDDLPLGHMRGHRILDDIATSIA